MSAGKLIRPDSTAIVLVDLQERLLPVIEHAGRVLANCQKLCRLAHILEISLFVTTQYERGLGPTDPGVLEAAGVTPLDKVCFGCFGDDPFRAALERAVPKGSTLLLAGIEAHICVMQTALGALGDGYRVHVAADAVGARKEENRQLGLRRMEASGAVISSTEMAIYELLGDSRRPEFKQMLPYLK